MDLSTFVNTPLISVFALYNSKKNKAHIMLAKNTLIRVATFIDELKYNKHANQELCDDLNDLERLLD